MAEPIDVLVVHDRHLRASMKISLNQLMAALPLPATDRRPEGAWDIEGFKRGTMSVVLFAPHGTDYQDSHEQDELYVVLSGSGTLALDDSRISFCQGAVLFVPARKRHHFESFTQDLVTGAVFCGPVGGEQYISATFLGEQIVLDQLALRRRYRTPNRVGCPLARFLKTNAS
jgi:mannose-6-phosphate isomerase-like protein (cupin superfamily)